MADHREPSNADVWSGRQTISIARYQEANMTKNQTSTARQPATKFPKLQKKLQQQKDAQQKVAHLQKTRGRKLW